MSEARGVCRECGAELTLTVVGTNPVGRPVRVCQNGHRQAGPVPNASAVVTDGGRQ